MDNVTSVKLKRGLSRIKKRLGEKIGVVWRLKKHQVIDKLKNLKYDYNPTSKSLQPSSTSAMIRKPTNIKI